MTRHQFQKPQRLFTGLDGLPPEAEPTTVAVEEPVVTATAVEPAKLPITRMQDMVLLHYCFNQQAGETKKEHCKCEEHAERLTRTEAERCVNNGMVDWLVVRSARAKTGKSIFRRAIVVRSVELDGERLFAITPRWQPKK